MELLWGDESSPGAAVPEVTGLPPGVILHADDLQDVTSFKGYSRILAGNCGILIRIVVKKSPHKQLRKEKPSVFSSSNRDAGDKKENNGLIHSSFLLLQLCELLRYPSDGNNIFICCFFTYVGVILRNDQTK